MKALFVCANPSLGVIFRLDSFRAGITNRLQESPLEWPNGKTVTAALVFASLGGDAAAVMPVGGVRGQVLAEQLKARGLRATTIPISEDTRATYTLLMSAQRRSRATQILEPGPVLSPQDQHLLLEETLSLSRTAEFCVIAGSLPRGVPSSFYRTLIERVRATSACEIFVDTSGPALQEAVRVGPELIKINLREFVTLARLPLDAPVATVLKAVARLARRFNIRTLIVTRRQRPVLAWDQQLGVVKATVPRVPLVNSVGAGDCFTGGFLSAWPEGLIEALRAGVAAGAATVSQAIPGTFPRKVFEDLRREVRVICPTL